MADQPTIKNYSAADIEKYQLGLLSDAERHAMEKAALEDPFLADAMEGFADAGPALQADLDDLKKRLAQRTEEKAKVVPLGSAGGSSFRWMRAAVLIGVLAGAGTLAYLFMFRGKQDEIAQVKDVNNSPVTTSSDSGNTNLAPSLLTADSAVQSGTASASVSKTEGKGNNTVADSIKYYNFETKGAGKQADDKSVSTELVIVDNRRKDLAKSSTWSGFENDKQKNEASKKENAPGNLTIPAETSDNMGYAETKAKMAAPVPAKKLADNNFINSNIFRGRVTDAQNLGVPFAKVINTDDNVGTYTDARGYFNLTSPDSVLNVQIRSIGFENNATQIRNAIPNNQVVLQNDHRMNALVINNQRSNTNRRANNNVQLQEPEPADGWQNYDTYLSNNLVLPEELKNKPAGSSAATVEVSFEVDAKGQPINIRVEKSLCEKCDKEAIRLIKEGPKWKQNTRNGRTTVTVPFSQLF